MRNSVSGRKWDTASIPLALIRILGETLKERLTHDEVASIVPFCQSLIISNRFTNTLTALFDGRPQVV